MIRDLSPEEYPALLKEIPDPPKNLRLEGSLPPPQYKLLAVVGSRKFSPYGKRVCEELIESLKGEPISIVSGLALGIDSIAHEAALRAGLHTLAIPGSGLDRSVIHPKSHIDLANRIVANGGGLLSEYEDKMSYPGKWVFPKRNRLMAGLCHAVLVIEAGEKSGTLITSRLATEYNRDVGAVPGDISNKNSSGPHMLLGLGAAVIRNKEDILELLQIENG